MNVRARNAGILMLSLLMMVGLSVSTAFAAGKTYTGTVSDAMCGAKHMMEGDPASCLRACVQKGSKYALVVGDKVYTLDTRDKSSSDALNKLAGQQAAWCLARSKREFVMERLKTIAQGRVTATAGTGGNA